MAHRRFRACLWLGLVLAALSCAANVRTYLVYESAIPEADYLIPLDVHVVERALGMMPLSQQQRDVILNGVNGDRRSIESIHHALMGSLHLLQNQYRNGAIEWSIMALLFAILLFWDHRRTH